MIELKTVLVIHELLIQQHGGSAGVRNMQSLESAIARPYSTFDGEELYPTAFEKAAALAESIIQNHPFVDGNKRTGYVLMRLVLLQNGEDIIADEQAKYDFITSIASGQLNFEEIVDWLKVHKT